MDSILVLSIALAERWLAILGEAALKGLPLLVLTLVLAAPRPKANASHRAWFLALGLTSLLCLTALTAVGWPRLYLITVRRPGQVSSSLRAGIPISTAQPPTERVHGITGPAANPPLKANTSDGLPVPLFLTWLTGFSFFTIRAVRRTVSLCKLRHTAVPVADPDLLALADGLRLSLGLRQSVRLLASPLVAVPAVCGVDRSCILLPPSVLQWTLGDLRPILLHELEHLRRHDILSRLVAGLALALYWFNPLVWSAQRNLRAAQEEACDDAVLRGGVGAADYAAQLLKTIHTCLGHIGPEPALGAGGSSIERRVKRLFSETYRGSAIMKPWQRLSYVLLFVLICTVLGGVKAAGEPSFSPPLDVRYKVTSPFGWRTDPLTGQRSLHRGIDLAAPFGSPVLAAADGVVFQTYQDDGYGRYVILDHGHGLITLYAQLYQISVEPGDRVRNGQRLGLVGSSGRSTGPHLHFEIQVEGKPVNPVTYLAFVEAGGPAAPAGEGATEDAANPPATMTAVTNSTGYMVAVEKATLPDIGSLAWPLRDEYKISCPFGWRTHPITGEKVLHIGVDLAAPMGTPVMASATGTIISAGWKDAYGYTVIVQHSGRILTLYAKLSATAVNEGAEIHQGDVLGYVGSTGIATGPHLHYEVHLDGQTVDPLLYL